MPLLNVDYCGSDNVSFSKSYFITILVIAIGHWPKLINVAVFNLKTSWLDILNALKIIKIFVF
jgi:hypothetical protein